MDNIKLLRKRQGLTQQQLAERLHVVRQTVSKWEKGESAPDGDMLPAVAEALGVPLEELMGLERPEPWYYRLKKPLFIALLCACVMCIGANIKVRQLRNEDCFNILYLRLNFILTCAVSFSIGGAAACLIPWEKRRPTLAWAFIALAVIFTQSIILWYLGLWQFDIPLLRKIILFCTAKTNLQIFYTVSGALFFAGVGLLRKR